MERTSERQEASNDRGSLRPSFCRIMSYRSAWSASWSVILCSYRSHTVHLGCSQPSPHERDRSWRFQSSLVTGGNVVSRGSRGWAETEVNGPVCRLEWSIPARFFVTFGSSRLFLGSFHLYPRRFFSFHSIRSAGRTSERRERESDAGKDGDMEAVNLSFSFRTPSISWLKRILYVKVKSQRNRRWAGPAASPLLSVLRLSFRSVAPVPGSCLRRVKSEGTEAA